MFWYTFWLFVGTSIISAWLSPKPKGAEPSGTGDFGVPTAEEGRAISLVYGTCKVAGPNVTWWGDVKTKAIKTESGGFLGIGSKSVTIGYKYYLGLQMALCAGPVDALVDVLVGDKALGISRSYSAGGSTVTLNAPNLFGGDKQEGGISGPMAFYFGSDTQTGDSYLSGKWGTTAPGYRGVCHVVLRQIYIGTQPYMKDWAFVLRRCPSPGGLNSDKASIGGDCNPAHLVADLLTLDAEKGGLGLSVDRLDMTSFQAAANTLYTEGFGVSLLLDSERGADEWLGEVCRTVDAVLYTDPSSGLWTFKLVRDDYTPADLPEFGPDDIVAEPEFSRPSWGETLNKVVVQYLDRSAGYATRTAQDQDAANRAIRGEEAAATIAFMAIPNATTAQKVVAREMRGRAYPLAKLRLVVNRRAWALRPGSPFRFTWPELGISQMVCRVNSIRYGALEAGQITIEAVEDIFSTPTATFSTPPASGWVDPVQTPTPAAAQALVEAPYAIVGESRQVLTLAARADSATLSMDIWTDAGAGYAATGEVTHPNPTGLLTGAWSAKTAALDATGFTVGSGADLAELPAMSTNSDGRTLGKNLALVDSEWISWTTATDNGDGTVSISGVLRGVLDSVPADHSLGARVWFLPGTATSTMDPGGSGSGSSTPGPVGPQGRGYTWCGEWSESATYLVDYLVQRNGSTYVALATNTTQDPATHPEYWSLWAERGDQGPQGESAFTRSTASLTTASLAAGGSATGTMTIRKVADLLKLTTDYPAWVRVYGTSAQRTADAARPITEDPVPGAGCFLDASTEAGALTVTCSPVPVFVNGDGTPADTAYVAIQNLDSVSRAITVDITYLPQEA